MVARSFARIHWQNLVNFGVLPLRLSGDCYDRIDQGDVFRLENVHGALQGEGALRLRNETRGEEIAVEHGLSSRQAEVLLAGGLINWVKARRSS